MKKKYYPFIVCLFLICFLWELFGYVFVENRFVFPTLSSIFLRFFEQPELFLSNSWITFKEMMGGFFSGFAFIFASRMAYVCLP